MKRFDEHNSHYECMHKIEDILKEYNCKIEFDDELQGVLLIDKDTNRFIPLKEDKGKTVAREY